MCKPDCESINPTTIELNINKIKKDFIQSYH